jgi:hypothetical protein
LAASAFDTHRLLAVLRDAPPDDAVVFRVWFAPAYESRRERSAGDGHRDPIERQARVPMTRLSLVQPSGSDQRGEVRVCGAFSLAARYTGTVLPHIGTVDQTFP